MAAEVKYTLSELYKGEVTMRFYPVKHGYKIHNEKPWLIGVTTACGMKDKSRPLLIWASRLIRDYLFKLIGEGVQITQKEVLSAVDSHEFTKNEAADIGKEIHKWIEDYIVSGEKPPTPEDERVRLGVIAFLQWKKENDVEFLEIEKVIYSKKYGYVGTLDAIANVNGVPTLIDFKSSKGIYLSHRYQTAAYLKAWNEEHQTSIKNRMILRLGKFDGDFQAESFDDFEQLELDFKCFLACLLLKQHDKREIKWQKAINA